MESDVLFFVLFMITGRCSSRYLNDFFPQLSIQLLKFVTTGLVGLVVSWVFWGTLFTVSILFPHLFHNRISVSGVDFLSTLIVS